jgi:hypothetical protein
MTRRRRPWGALLAVALVVPLLLSVLPNLAGGAGSGTPLSSAPVPDSNSPARAVALAASGPQQTPACNIFIPTYGEVGTVYPFTPLIEQQVCAPISMDEVHASFGSDQAGSGEHWSVPVHLPAKGPGGGQIDAYDAAYVGMVVSGDPSSVDGQSYLQVAFVPTYNGSAVAYTEEAGILSFVETPSCSGLQVTFTAQGAPGYFCEENDLAFPNGLTLATGVPGNTWVNVSFAGRAGGAGGMTFWVNDSESPSLSRTLTLNAATTDTYSFEPSYSAACPDSCELNWTYPFGLGIGFDMCPTQGSGNVVNVGPQACDSYNETRWTDDPPVEFGVPRFFENGSYSGEYLYLSPESSSGVCNQNPPVGFAVAACYNEDWSGGEDFYPYFSLNGSELDFGGNFPWTQTDFGGAAGQFQSTGFAEDIVPFVVEAVENSSRAGFLPPATPLTVDAQLVAWGNITSATLRYSIGGGTPTDVPMAQSSGTPQSANFSATIPSTGGNGTIRYQVFGFDSAGGEVASVASTVVRGTLPTFTLGFTVRPASCGLIELNGTDYGNANATSLLPGTYPVSSSSCYPYAFAGWKTTADLRVAAPVGRSTQLSVSGNGSLTADWNWVRPHVVVDVRTDPVNCGSVLLNGTTYANGGVGPLYFGVPVPVALNATCAGYSFSGWTVTGNLSVLGGQFTAGGNGTLTADFIAAGTGSSLTFAVAPAGCGGILYRGAGYTDGQSLYVSSSPYPVAPDPCTHWAFESWNTSAGLSVADGNLTVTASGSLTEADYLQTWVQVATYPADCGSVRIDGVGYTNGQVDLVANNSFHTVVATPCNDTHLVNMTGTQGLSVHGDLLNATGAGGTLDVVFASGPDVVFLGFVTQPTGCGSIVLGAVSYVNTNSVEVPPGTTLPIDAVPCANYGFVGWTTSSVETGGIAIVNGTAWINASGSVTATFAPEIELFLYTDPGDCGEIHLGSTTYPGNSSLVLTATVGYSISATACSGMSFAGWRLSADVSIENGSLVANDSGIATAVFNPTVFRLDVTISPERCNEVTVAGRTIGNGTAISLGAGNYTLGALPCTGQELVRFATTGGASIEGGTLDLSGSATLTAEFGWIPPSVTLIAPPTVPEGTSVVLTASVAVPIPPYDYNFTWSFGDGSPNVTTSANFTSHVFSGPGAYRVSVTVLDPVGRSAGANATVTVLSAGGGLGGAVLWVPLSIALGAVGATVLVALLLSGRRRPRDPSGLGTGVPPTETPARESDADGPPVSGTSGIGIPASRRRNAPPFGDSFPAGLGMRSPRGSRA